MCEANVYLEDDFGDISLLLDSVDKVIPTDDTIYLENIFGERKNVTAKIKEMDLVDHRIILRSLKQIA